ncbi:lytic murein transglycosylase [Nocardioides islandensis]|uniref:Lytic murein transglycosylase n=1 Tax=Nocardioides islandensis TaxID=433663 RepID=A0A930V9R1_9ACTN|nr:lytic murein transglycosylase [Nocardioides islandensis]MBF4762513.1 lytic murein transglycosylase [Nocardioides islandensis]
MSEARFGRLQKAATLVPLALLSAAWSVSIVGVGLTGSTATSADGGTLPDGSTVPEEAIEAPASLTGSSKLAPGINGDPQEAVLNAATNGIPSAALAAYQRAETVINAADTTCHLPWQLVAAIGRVESNHGSVHGSHLTSAGLAAPPIYGLPLDGTHDTTTIADTDGGALDGDTANDRAVGPMQFIPSTWSIVGVDSDGDGQRNPQDIDDAALATAVYLCSGNDDLSTDEGRRTSVFRYNHSQEYVDLVLAFYQAYVDGEFTSVPNGTYGGGASLPPGDPTGGGGGGGGGGHPTASPEPTKGPTTKATPTKKPTPTPTSGPTAGPTTASTPQPTAGPTSVLPTKTPTVAPTTAVPTILPTELPTVLPTELPTTILTPILSLADAIVQCTAQGLVDNPLNNNDAFDQCVASLTGG